MTAPSLTPDAEGWLRTWPKTAMRELAALPDRALEPFGRMPVLGEAARGAKALDVLRGLAAPTEGLPAPLARAVREVIERRQRAEVIASVDEGALTLALARHCGALPRPGWPDVLALLAEGGLALAIRVLCGGGAIHLRPGTPWAHSEQPPIGEPLVAFEALRERLSVASEGELTAARAVAKKERAAGGDVAAKLAYAFADEAWAKTDWATIERGSDAPFSGATLALLSVLPAAEASALVRAAIPRWSKVDWPSSAFVTTDETLPHRKVAGLAAHVFDHLLRVGEAGIVNAALLLEAALDQKEGAVARRVALALALFGTPAAAEVLAHHLGRKDVDKITTEYFRAHPRLAVAHLAERAKKKSKIGEHARTLLLEAERLLAAAQSAPERSTDEAPDDALPTVLQRVPWRRKRRTKADAALDARLFEGLPDTVPALPRWLDLSRLPRPTLRDGRALSLQAFAHLVEMLRFVEANAPYAGLADVRGALDPARAAEVARALLATFEAADHRGEDLWPIRAAGALGGEPLRTDLVARFDETTYGDHEVSALRHALADALRLASVHAPFELWSQVMKAVHPRASADVSAIVAAEAQRRGVPLRTMALSALPTAGFDVRGRAPISHGFSAELDASLAVHALDASGRRTAPDVLSTPLRSLAQEVGALQAVLLWWLEDFVLAERAPIELTDLRLLAAHPIAGRIVTRLLFEVGAERVRIAEDQTFARLDDTTLDPPASARFFLAHPALLDEAERRAWQERWASYELLWPFPQLERAPHTGLGAWLDALVDVAPVDGRGLPRLLSRSWLVTGSPKPATFDGSLDEGALSIGTPTKTGRVVRIGRNLQPTATCPGRYAVGLAFDPPLRERDARLVGARLVRLEREGPSRDPSLVTGAPASWDELDAVRRSELRMDIGRLLALRD